MKRIAFKKNWYFIILFVCVTNLKVKGQDTLPKFSVEDKGNGKIIVSWKNNFETLSQISVQRSYDSLKKFNTVYTAPSPELPQNGFTDQVSPGSKIYYRIFFVLQGGAYFFGASKRPTISLERNKVEDSKRDKVYETPRNDNTKPLKSFVIKVADSVYTSFAEPYFKRFRDSIMFRTKDTLFPLQKDTILIKKYIPPYVWKQSIYVYPDKDGFIAINLPQALTKKYDLKIWDEDGEQVLFEITSINQTYLVLDKTNFYHGGWYLFELKEDGKLKEKSKFFLAKDF